MDEISHKNFKQIASKLQRVVECPVCLGPLRPPVSLCDRGHGVCPECKKTLQQCPLCRSPYSNTVSPLTLNQILEALPRRCRYEPRGCLVTFWAGEDHEQFCCYRSTKCRVFGCVWYEAVQDILAHIRDSHSPPYNVLETQHQFFSYPNFDPNKESKAYTPIVISNTLLWQVTQMDLSRRKLLITFYQLPLERSQDELFVVVSLEKDSFQFQYTVRVSKRDEGDEDINSLDSVMAVPQSMLPKLIQTPGGLVSSLKVIKITK
uniref:RING-type domain-containing protein n=1 Tax=Graphocephala atropunctata TaxID=36148 RepID=A0A1B6KH73_9HEMI